MQGWRVGRRAEWPPVIETARSMARRHGGAALGIAAQYLIESVSDPPSRIYWGAVVQYLKQTNTN